VFEKMILSRQMLSFLLIKVFDVLIDLHELIVRCDIETRSFFEQRFDNLLLRVGLHRIVTLNPRQVLFECPVILPEFVVIDG